MKYLLMIYADEAAQAKKSEAEIAAMRQEYSALTTDAKARGVWLAGNALQPTSTATTVRVPAGKAVTIDGPFAETKEQLAGFYMLECKNLDDALEWAARIPSARDGSVEVRPIKEYN